MLINNALLLFYTSRARIFRLHFVYTVERRSEVFATPILLLDGWMMVEMRPQAVARREKPSCDRIGVARVFASTSTHARTHVHSSYKHRGVVHELLRVPSSTDLFFFSFFLPFFSTHPLPSFVHPDGSYSLRFPYGRG